MCLCHVGNVVLAGFWYTKDLALPLMMPMSHSTFKGGLAYLAKYFFNPFDFFLCGTWTKEILAKPKAFSRSRTADLDSG